MCEGLAAQAQSREEPTQPVATGPQRGKVVRQGPSPILRVAGRVPRRNKVATTVTRRIWDAVTGTAPSLSAVGMGTTMGLSRVSPGVSTSSAWVGAILPVDKAKGQSS